MKILVVDDNKEILSEASAKLKEKGYEVFVTGNGIESFQIISEKGIDLVILEVRMPCLSGFTLITMLKRFYFINIPVVLISSSHQEPLLLHSYGIEAASFFSKPINFESLFQRIEECCPSKVALT